MALKNSGRELLVETALGNESDPNTDDPLVLVHVSGAEGVSMPYAYELTMVGTKESEIAAAQIIGRRARFGIKKRLVVNTQDEPGHVLRFGVLETFERVPTINGRRVFRARLVPAFRMTAFEQVNRVFEERTLLNILTQVLEPFPLVDFRHELISDVKNEVIPYCVQYNETTFAFIHRLLDRFGIAYRFEHDEDLVRERMVLSAGIHRPRNVDVPMRVVGGDSKDFAAIAGFRRSFSAAPQNVRVGDFNTLDPRKPPVGIAVIDDGYAMGGESIGIRAEAFPMPRVDPADPDAAARLRMQRNETTVASATGRTRSTGFFAGRAVPIAFDDTGSGAEGSSWVLKLVTIEAFHFADDRSFFGKAFDFLKAVAGLETGRENDFVGVAAEQLRDRLKEDIPKGVEIYSWLDNKEGSKDPSGLPDFIATHLGRASAGIVGAAPLLYSSIKGIVEAIQSAFESASGFACAFEAFPVSDPFKPDRWPTPAAPRPTIAGPHLALVVGPKGVETTEQDIFTDALGRVRIRFPWDNGPDGEGDATADPPLSHERNTIWVRVSEGWAGARYGLQFLPRIGDEVLIGFIDGDPERPMVIGRTYNAASGNTHLPFPSLKAAKASLEKVEDLKGTINSTTTRSGLRTRSTPAKGATDAGFHMIRLEDEKGKEQFLLRAQHRLDITSTGSRFDTTRGSQHIIVGGGKPAEGEDSGGGLFTSVGGEQDLHVKQNRYLKVDSEESRIIVGNAFHKYEGLFIDAGKVGINCDDFRLSASKQIILFVGSSEVKITAAGVFCAGAMVQDKASGSSSMASTEFGEALDAAEADPGEPPDFLATRPKGKGGGRKKTKWGGREAIKVTKAPDGTLLLGKGGLAIKGDADFANKTLEDLADMRKDPAQREAVDKAMDRKNPATITRSPPDQDPNPEAIADSVDRTKKGEPTGIEDVDENGKSTPVLGTGKGAPTEVRYDPLRAPQEDPAARKKNLADALAGSQADDNGTQPGANAEPVPQAPPPPPPATGGAPNAARNSIGATEDEAQPGPGGAAPGGGAGGAPGGGSGGGAPSGGGAAPARPHNDQEHRTPDPGPGGGSGGGGSGGGSGGGGSGGGGGGPQEDEIAQ